MMSEITEKSKVIAEYLGWKYIPSNNLQGFPKAGWWRRECKTKEDIVFNKIHGDKLYICRNHNQLRFYNSFDALIPAIEKIEKEELSDYSYKWKDDRGLNNNFMGIEFMRWRNNSDFVIEWELDPVLSIGKGKGEGIVKDTFYAVYQAIEYINNLKQNYGE